LCGFGDDIFFSNDFEFACAFSINKYRRLRIEHDFSYAISMYIFPANLSLNIFYFEKRFCGENELNEFEKIRIEKILRCLRVLRSLIKEK